MKIILILLACLLLTIGSLRQQKPFNTVNEITYNIDKTISLKFTDHIIITICNNDTVRDISAFKQFFTKADLLSDYCSINSHSDIIISLGTYKDFNFVYMFKYNNYKGTSMLDIIYLLNDYSSYPIHINFIQLNNRFIDYLTTYRDKYYNDLKVYNDKLHKVNGSIDSLVKKK